MPFDKKKPPMKSVSGGFRGGNRPSMSKGQSTKAADSLAKMGFGKGMKMKG